MPTSNKTGGWREDVAGFLLSHRLKVFRCLFRVKLGSLERGGRLPPSTSFGVGDFVLEIALSLVNYPATRWI